MTYLDEGTKAQVLSALCGEPVLVECRTTQVHESWKDREARREALARRIADARAQLVKELR